MTSFWIGFIGAWAGALTVAATTYGLYLYETTQRAKAAKVLSDELKSILFEKLNGSRDLGRSDAKGNKFN